MDYLKSNNKTSKLEHETLDKVKKFAKTINNPDLESVLRTLSLSTNYDERFVLMLISVINKKCSSELLLALLYIIG